MISFLLRSFIMLSAMVYSRQVNFTQFELSKFNGENRWNQIIDKLSGENITSIRFENIHIWHETLKRILDLPKLSDSIRQLTFMNIVFNQELVSAFFKAPIIEKLENLTLGNCNLENKDFSLLDPQKIYKIKRLSLQSNFISTQGIKYLTNLKMPDLVSLDLFGISLATNQSIEHLLKINLSQLTQIDIGNTAISGYNAYRVISQLQPQTLIQLNISNNNFGLQFYKNLTKINFSNLKHISLSRLFIDEDAVPFLQNWTFPQLTSLNMGSNWLFVDGLYKFINAKNYPKLKIFIINSVVFSLDFFRHFVTQFKSFKFEWLEIMGHDIQPQEFQYLSRLDTSKLKRLKIMKAFANPSAISDFFAQKQFNELEQLNLGDTINTGRLLETILLKKWPKLKQLYMLRIGSVNMSKIRQINHKSFPQLQHITMDARSLQKNEFRQLIFELSKHSNKIISIRARVSQYERVIMDIIEGNYQNISHAISFSLISYQQSFIHQFQTVKFKVVLHPKSKAIIKQLKFVSSIQDLVDSTFKTKEEITKLLLTSFDYSQIEKFSDDENCTLISHFQSQFKKQNKKCVLSSAQEIIVLNLTLINSNIMNNCEYPHLRLIHLSLNDTFNFNKTESPFFTTKISQVISAKLIFSSAERQQIIKFITDQKFHSLSQLYLQKCKVRSEDLKQLLKNNKNMRRIRLIDLRSVGIEKDLTFFEQYNMSLKQLSLGWTLISPSLNQLSSLNFQFMTDLTLFSTGISNQQFINFLQSIPYKSEAAFPKLMQLELSNNYIQNSGTAKLFKMGTPNLNGFEMNMNKDNNIMNTVFNSANSQRITQIAFYKNQQDSIDHNINPKSTRNIKKLIVQSPNLRAIDMKALSRLDLRSLRQVILDFPEKFECQIFNHITKFIYNCQQVFILLGKGNQNLNSRCFSQNKPNYSFKYLSKIYLVSFDQIHADLRHFSEHLLGTVKFVDYVVMIGIYPTKQSIIKFFKQTNLDHLNRIDLRYNGLVDDAVSHLFALSLQQTQSIQIGNNPALTTQSIKLMRNKVYPSLKFLNIGYTSIDDLGIQILLSCQFPSLIVLNLENMEITNKSISLLSNLKAPFLNTIDLSVNDLTYDDIKKFQVKNFKYLNKIVIYPYLKVKQVQQLKKVFNQGRPENSKIEIETNLIQLQQNWNQIQDEYQ